MQPVSFPSANHIASPADKGQDLEAVPTRVLGNVQTTVWRPTELELAKLKRNGLITVTIYSPHMPPLVGVGVADESEYELRSEAAG